MEGLGFAIFISTILYIDYKLFIRSGDSFFMGDKSQFEKELRELQKLEVIEKIEKIKKEKIKCKH